MSRVFSGLLALAVMASSTMAMADRALVIGASEEERRGLFRFDAEPDTGQALRDAGFEVMTADAGSISEMRAALSRFLDGIGDEERVVVHLSGTFLRGDGRSWLMPAGASVKPDLATVDDTGLSVDTVLAIAGRVPGGAVVAIGRTAGDAEPGTGLRRGVSLNGIPQGVTVVDGETADVARFVAGALLEPGRNLPDAIEASKGVQARGFLSERVVFLPKDEERPVAPPNTAEVERAIWQATLAQDTVKGFESYLERYPEGFFVTEAREGIDRIRNEPNRQARIAEEALELSREDRRAIQRDLTLLGYNPRGVDGVFGPGSRAAITRYQAKAGFPGTGFLDETQIERLGLQVERHKAEVAAEKRRQELEAEKKDREAWAAVAETGDEAGLRAYLELHPKGLFAPIARERLDVIEAEARTQAEALEKSDWEKASDSGTVQSLNAYLKAHPEGAHAAAARERLEVLAQAESDAANAARAEEAAMELNTVTRMLVERRLAQLQLDPGEVDGTFDDNTRAALRQYQRDRDLAVTGYMNEQVVSQMLADLGGILAPGR